MLPFFNRARLDGNEARDWCRVDKARIFFDCGRPAGIQKCSNTLSLGIRASITIFPPRSRLGLGLSRITFLVSSYTAVWLSMSAP